MILVITERYELVEKEIGFTERFYITKYFKDIFEKLNITLFPVLTENNLEEIEKICDGLILTGSNIDINPIYYGEEDKKEVNSFHHQAIKNVAQGFNVTALSNDNTIEAIEKGNVIGVQWHPEKMNDLSFFRSFTNL